MTPNWTNERPTKPGEYWLSLPPDFRMRSECDDVQDVVLYQADTKRLVVSLRVNNTHVNWLVSAATFDGALWAPRETPADPFKEVGT